ncbi:hypothetical protein CSIM01_00450 [Colletotrichum simmondsii]|uniref:Mitochondrial 2-oxoglutarate/malate carrier protein n=1 Tax=Colletotrichum simmondsii TaxID=703756 RepID=A0A135SF48_9PEZI|nr:hypothetical protein CSIM01_00450 [Colletotrichum simmondsii]
MASSFREKGHRSRGLVDVCAPFATGCASGMIATTCVQPIDTIKVRMQLMEQSLSRSSPWSVAKAITLQNGILNLYQGLSAGLLRQLVYGTLRLGLFSTLEQRLQDRAKEQGTVLGFGGRALAGLTAGAIAAFIGNPTEVALIRMQADGMLPMEQRQRYASAFNALRRIARQEGVLSLWKGVSPTVIRAMSTNFGQLAFFSETKHQLQTHTQLSKRNLTAVASSFAGFAGAIISLPFDFVKTRLQNQPSSGNSKGLLTYSGTFDCFAQVIRREGFLRFYRDFWPYFLRIGPHSAIALFLADLMNENIRNRGYGF